MGTICGSCGKTISLGDRLRTGPMLCRECARSGRKGSSAAQLDQATVRGGLDTGWPLGRNRLPSDVILQEGESATRHECCLKG